MFTESYLLFLFLDIASLSFHAIFFLPIHYVFEILLHRLYVTTDIVS